MTLSGAVPGGVVGFVPGAWDMFHVGHLNILLRAREHCDRLIVGVVTDERLAAVKGRPPVVPLAERMEVVGALDLVDRVVVDDSTDKKQMWELLHFDVIFKGDDWRGTPKGDQLERGMKEVGAEVHYFAYTPHTSSSRIRNLLARRLGPEVLETVADARDPDEFGGSNPGRGIRSD